MNAISNTAATLSPEVVAWCADYAGFALTLAKAFLVLALLVALVETALALWAKVEAARKGPVVAQDANTRAATVDPVKLLEALKALLDALKGLPAWIAIFLAGLALLWIAGEKPKICAPPEVRCPQGQNCPPVRPARAEPGGASNTQAVANTQ